MWDGITAEIEAAKANVAAAGKKRRRRQPAVARQLVVLSDAPEQLHTLPPLPPARPRRRPLIGRLLGLTR